jgi:hypothetical protein
MTTIISGEKSLFWTTSNLKHPLQATLSDTRYPEENSISPVIFNPGKNIINEFSNSQKELTEGFKDTGVLYLIFENLEGSFAENGFNLDLGVSGAYRVMANQDYMFKVKGDKGLGIMMKYRGLGNGHDDNYLKLKVEKFFSEGKLEGFGKFSKGLPTYRDKDFKLDEYSSKLFGFVVDKDNSPQCYQKNKDCWVRLQLKLSHGMQTIQFRAHSVKGIDNLKNDQSVVRKLFM